MIGPTLRQLRVDRRRGAFTLIELLVVILILGILASLVVPRVVGRTEDAKIAKAASDIATLGSVLQQYRVDNDAFPTSDEGLNALRVQPADATNWRGPYTSREIPLDPWGNPYVYESPGANGEDFSITSYGADGAAGGTAENSDITSE
jgi:general secretion pathway protein G